MKKIMFNDRYGLTQAVLDGRKTMTRRVIPDIWIDFPRSGRQKAVIAGLDSQVLMMDLSHVLGENCLYSADRKYQPKYYKGDEVAVAQSYSNAYYVLKNKYGKDVADDWGFNVFKTLGSIPPLDKRAGWTNKMFVRADLMPHRIRITDIKVERLQDISDEDCIREGIVQDYDGVDSYSFNEPATLRFSGKDVFRRCTYAETPKAAFAALIDCISGKGTWERNPWVYAYEFELIK